MDDKLKEAKDQANEAKQNEALKDEIIKKLQDDIRDLEKKLREKEEAIQQMDNLKKENAILSSAKKADEEKINWLENDKENDKENFDNFTKKVTDSVYNKPSSFL